MADTPSASAPPAFTMPALTEQHARLARLAGSWRGEEKLFPSPWLPEGGTADAEVEAAVGLDGFFLIMDYTERRGDRVYYRGHGVFSYDAAAERYVQYWFDSVGSIVPAPATGTWDGDTLQFRSSGNGMEGRYTYVFDGPDKYRFRIENSRDGGATWSTFMEARYRRA